jgi:hypothetical protein
MRPVVSMLQIYVYEVPRPFSHSREGMTESSSTLLRRDSRSLHLSKILWIRWIVLDLEAQLPHEDFANTRDHNRTMIHPHTDRSNFLWETGFPAFIAWSQVERDSD